MSSDEMRATIARLEARIESLEEQVARIPKIERYLGFLSSVVHGIKMKLFTDPKDQLMRIYRVGSASNHQKHSQD